MLSCLKPYRTSAACFAARPDLVRTAHLSNKTHQPIRTSLVAAGGVAVSGLEMSQNATWVQWSREDVDQKLREIMKTIYDTCNDTAKQYDTTLQDGANIAGFQKVAAAMNAQGVL